MNGTLHEICGGHTIWESELVQKYSINLWKNKSKTLNIKGNDAVELGYSNNLWCIYKRGLVYIKPSCACLAWPEEQFSDIEQSSDIDQIQKISYKIILDKILKMPQSGVGSMQGKNDNNNNNNDRNNLFFFWYW